MIQKNSSKLVLEELGKNCNSCGHCCTNGSGFILQDEVKMLAKFLKISEEEFKEKYTEKFDAFSKEHLRFKQKRTKNLPYGNCVFLENKNCKIHKVKPLYCKIGNCGEYANQAIQWFHLNYSVDKFNPNSIRAWKIYTDQNEVIKGGMPEEIVKDKEVLSKILNYEIL